MTNLIRYVKGDPTANLQPSTRQALARAHDGIATLEDAKRAGDPRVLVRAHGEALLAKDALEAANGEEKAMAEMRKAMANPVNRRA